MKKAAIYARVSTQEQKIEGTSLDSPLEFNLNKAKELDLETDGYIIEEVWPGLTLDRPKLNQVRDWVRQKQIKAVIVYST